MSAQEVVTNFMSTIEEGKFEDAGNLMTDFFNIELPLPFPIGKPQLLMFMQMFKTALPNWKYNYQFISEEGNKITGSVQVEGTHTNDFVFPGLPPIKALGNILKLPAVNIEFTVEDSKVSKMKVQNLPMDMLTSKLKDMGIGLPGI